MRLEKLRADLMKRKIILITGASSGLGRGMAIEFANKGYNLALCARRTERLTELKEQLQEKNPTIQVEVKELDVNHHKMVFKVFKEFAKIFGRLDKVIINAGIRKGASIGTGYFNANKQTAETNFIAALAQAEASMEIFRNQNAGHLVMISSISAIRGFPRAMTVYSATKAAITSLSEGIRIDTLNTPIKVSCIHPGFIRSEINEKVKKLPFIVDTKTGCRSMVKAIESEKANSYAPSWPWSWLKWIIRIAPLKFLAKIS
jgi:short-subunit dehydrogenase